MSDRRTAAPGDGSDAREETSLKGWRRHARVSDRTGGPSLALGDKLRAVVLYGPAARGERPSGDSEIHLLVVLADLALETLAAAGPALGRWIGRGRAMPRLFTPATLREAADVFPVEL